ncbi:hypothetical protein [Pandoraea sp. CB10b_02]|uniref:hypothetical protein n=1 Tax=Pandoraea sp. CB10b_02 TaxID=2014535 RepID=UPI00257CB780|nr:hypothetical protein [Pandoraea sp. CB10b_02]
MKRTDDWLHAIIAEQRRQFDDLHAKMVDGVRQQQARIAELVKENADLRRAASLAAEERKS